MDVSSQRALSLYEVIRDDIISGRLKPNERLVVAGLASDAPAKRAGLKIGDIVVAIGGEEVADLASLYRKLWARGAAGIAVPLTLFRDGRTLEIEVRSADRARFLKSPSLH